ncbi:TetR/AcrR family transcriptional regulator [Halanaerobaculum tunisiense]
MSNNKKEQKIIEAALDLFSKQGYHKTTVDQIAQQADIAKGTVYWYFDSKKHLFIGILLSGVKNLHQRIRKQIVQEGSTVDKLYKITESSLDFFKEGEKLSKMYYENAVGIDQEFKEQLLELKQEMVVFIADVIAEGQQEGVLSTEISKQEAAKFLLGMIDTHNPHFHSTDFIVSEKAQQIVDLFLNGVGN